MPALKAIFSADSTPFAKELREAEKLSQRAGKNIERALTGSTVVGHSGQSGVIRESLVLMREMSAGNWTRVPGSVSLLLQRMGLLKLIFKDSAAAANVVADAYGKLAVQSSAAALAATQKAAASEVAFAADVENTEATLAQALADGEAATAARANAAAMVQKAEAAQAAAVAQSEGAAATAATVGAVGIVAGIVVAISVGLYAAYKLSGALVERLSGLKFPEFHPEYIAQHLRASNQVAEGWKDINKQVEKAVDNYNSVAKAAERVADATKTHFDHERKMAELAKQRDMANARTPQEKAKIEKDYAQKQIDIDALERQQEINNKNTEMFNLQREGEKKKREADSIKVNSKEHDANILSKQKQQAEEAQKYLDDLQKERTEGPAFGEKVVRGYNAVALSGVSGNDLDAARKANEAEARRRIEAYGNAVESTAANDELRKKKAELTKSAGDSFAKAAEIGADLPNLAAKAKEKTANAQAEAAARNQAEQAQLNSESKDKALHGTVNSLQQVGAYASPATVALIDPIRKSERHLQGILNHLTKQHKSPQGPMGGVNHG